MKWRFISILLLALLISFIGRYGKDLPAKVTVISRTEKTIREYEGNPIIKEGKLVIQDAVLIKEKDVSRLRE